MGSVLVPLADGCEELEAVTIIDILRRAGVEVVVAGLADGPVRASRGTVLLPETTLEAVREREFDLIVLPGGLPGADHLQADTRLITLLQQSVARGHKVAAICAAPKVLAHAGLLQGRHATAYPGALEGCGVDGFVRLDEPVVEDGPVITSMGPGTALDFALHLVETLCGHEQREAVERPLCRPHGGAGHGEAV